MAKDYYKILDLNKTNSKDTIKKACRDVAKRLNPYLKRGLLKIEEDVFERMTSEDLG